MTNREKYIFSEKKFLKSFANNLEWIAISVVILVPVIGFSSDNIPNLRVIIGTFFGAIVLFSITFIVILIIKKIAYKIVLDFKNNVIFFYMLRNQGVITENLSDIDRVFINYCISFYRITFYIGNKKIKYQKDYHNYDNTGDLIKLLEENFKVKKKFWGIFFFPNKKRDTFKG